MKAKRLLPLFLFAGVLTGVYTFDLRKAWADEAPVPAALAPAGESALAGEATVEAEGN